MADLYARVRADSRHIIDVAICLDADQPRFPNWSMRLLDPLWHPTGQALDAIEDLLAVSTSDLHDDAVVGALSGLVDRVRADGA